MKSPYDVLGVSVDASHSEIKVAYKRLASKYHPDKSSYPDSSEKFKELQDAYDMVKNEEKRKIHDYHFNAEKDDKFSKFRAENSPFSRNTTFTQQIEYTITLEQSYSGYKFNSRFGIVTIPKGARHGTKLSCGKNLILISVKKHHKFKRCDDDLLVDINISCLEALTGIDATLVCLDGNTIKFKIPESTQNEQIIRLAGKGMPNPELPRYGDMLIRCNIYIPELTKHEKEHIMSIQSRKNIDI